MKKKCKLPKSKTLRCGQPQCSVKSELELLNPDATFTCIESNGGKQTIRCDVDGKTSTRTGKRKQLVKWAKGNQCKAEGSFDCKCQNQVSNFKDVKCIRQDVYQCTTTGGVTTIFSAKKCKKVTKKATCALNAGNNIRSTDKKIKNKGKKGNKKNKG